MTLRALIFDVDGTLADTEETHRQAFNYAFVRFGFAWEWSKPLYRRLLRISGGKERIAHYIDTLDVPASERKRLHGYVVALHEAKTRLYTELVADGRCPLLVGVARLLDEASDAGLQLAIASTTSMANVEALIERHLAGNRRIRFGAIACGDYVANKKPAPDIYHLALSMLGRSAQECVAFEDSANGLIAAKRAELFTVVTPSQWTKGDAFDDADVVLPHLGDVDRPLADAAAATAGGSWLSIAALRVRHADAAQCAAEGKG